MKTRAERIARVTAELAHKGVHCGIVRLESNTATAELAAQALGCGVSQIVKSLVFVGSRGEEERLLLVLMGGIYRVDMDKLARLWGGDIAKATAAQVKEATGFEIGGVPPLGHSSPLETFMDGSLLEEDRLWAAAGSAHAVFPVEPEMLREATCARIADLREPVAVAAASI